MKIWYFDDNCLLKDKIWKSDFGYLPHTANISFYFIDFQLNADFPTQFCFYYHKSHSVIQRSVSRENAF